MDQATIAAGARVMEYYVAIELKKMQAIAVRTQPKTITSRK